MHDDPAVEARLRALVERVVAGARLPPSIRDEAREDYLEYLRADVDRRAAAGVSRDRAVEDAIAAFGRPDVVSQALEAGVMMDGFARNLSNAVRALRRRPLTSLAAVVTLAIGVGVNGAVFSVVDWVLMRPLPYPAPQELVRVYTAGTAPVTAPAEVTHTEFASFDHARGLRSIVGFSSATRIIGGSGIEPIHGNVARITGDLSITFGMKPSLGRTFTNQEIEQGAPVVLLSGALWEHLFHRDDQIVGKIITIDGAAHTVIGVVDGPSYPPDTDVWRPITADEREDDDRELRVVARLLPQQSAALISTELAALANGGSSGARTAWAEDMQRSEVKGVERALVMLFGSAMLILLIACANVAALIAARGQDRGAEIAVREALGASRGQLIVQLLSESVVLAIAGGIAGLLLGRWTLGAIIAIAPASLPRLTEISLDMRVVGLGLLATIAVGIIVGLAPAFRASRPGRDAQSRGAGSTRVTERSYARRVLVVAQVAMAVIITAGAGLLARSLVNMINTPNGFDAERLISVELSLRSAVSGDSRPLFRELTAAAASLDGVSSAAVAMRLPTQTLGIRTPVSIIGKSTEPARAVLRPIGPAYFEAASIGLSAGRAFSSTDLRDTPRVAIVNATAVREMFGDQSPIGSRITTPLTSAPMEIVGVVDDVRPAGEADRPALYVPLEQLSIGEGYLLVRAEGNPTALLPILRERLRSVAPALALDRMQLVRQTLEESRAATRFNSTLAGAFALLALLLAAVGVYGLTASEVASRWRELAVRLALGASPSQALWTVLRPCAMLLAAGAGIGVLVAIGLSPRLAALLYQVDPRDRVTLASAPALLCLTGLIAAAGAAAKILRADPTITLRE